MKKFDCVIQSGATKLRSRRISTCLFISVLCAFLAACDDSSSASAGNNEPTTLSGAEGQGSSSSSLVISADSESLYSSSRRCEECNDEAISSSGNAELNGFSRFSSSETKTESSSSEKLSETSSCSEDDDEYSSSSVKKTSWDYLNPDIDYDEFTDKRDGQVYKIVQIGEQIWMAQNLNYEMENSWCGGGSGTTEGDCETYGRLYTWAAAIGKSKAECGYGLNCDLASADSATFIQGVCPDGWHVPSKSEWEDLFAAVGGPSTAGDKLKATTLWETEKGITSEDAYGFSALTAGRRVDGYFRNTGYYGAFFWSATENDRRFAYCVSLCYNYHFAELDAFHKELGSSVRCLKD